MVDLSQNFFNSSLAASHAERREGTVLPPRPTPDPEQLRRLLTSPEGLALVRLLRADGGEGIKKAVSALQTGNAEGAKAALAPLLAGTEAEALAQSLEGKL